MPQTARVHSNLPLSGADQTDSNQHESEARVNGSSQVKKYIKLVGTNRSNFIQKQFVTMQNSSNNLLNNYYQSLQRQHEKYKTDFKNDPAEATSGN